MNYIRVEWHHPLQSEPVLIYSEIDEDRWERRKIEVYVDGRHDFADVADAKSATKLSTEPLPSLLEIAADPQFVPVQISQSEFENVWALRETEGRADSKVASSKA
jgi:hypothetical protein